MNKIKEARKILEDNGYVLGSLFQLEDVDVNCDKVFLNLLTDKDKRYIVEMALESHICTINEAIKQITEEVIEGKNE